MVYLQDEYPKDRYPDRQYFFTVLNTVYPEFVSDAIAHANAERFSAQGERGQTERVLISEEWWDNLNKLPYFSRKYITESSSCRF